MCPAHIPHLLTYTNLSGLMTNISRYPFLSDQSGSSRLHRQKDADPDPTAEFTVDLDPAMMKFNDSFDNH
jgi:hypothetical protein